MTHRDLNGSPEPRAKISSVHARGPWPLVASALLLTAALAAAPPASAQSLAITGATVYATPDQKLEHATVVIKDGVIVAVGADVAAPAGATVIAGAGKVVTAGLIESDTQLGLVEIDAEPSGADGRFGTAPTEIHAAYRSTDAFDPRAVGIPIARSGGVTSIIATPAGGLLAGQSAWMALADSGKPLPPISATAAMNAALGADAVATKSRGQAIERLREVLDDAAQYDRNRAAFERNQSRKLAAERLDLEALVPVLRGTIPLVIAADAESDVRAALALAKERRLRIVIAGGGEAWRVAEELAAAKVAVILDPSANLPDELAAGDVRDDNAAILVKAGVAVAISTLGSTTAPRTLRQLAGIAVGNGLPWERALAAITSVPAATFGAPQRGVIARGGPADLVVWSGDPLEISSRAEVVLIGGVPQSSVSHQTRLRDRYRKLPAKR
jgi:imidazolonepropionase-like amidohydrolase